MRLFRIGWRILLQIPKHVTDELVTTLRSTKVTEKLFDRKWILTEVDASLDELADNVGNALFEEAQTNLLLISMVLEKDTCDALKLLISDYPRYPLDGQTRYVESMDDISNIDAFLRSLADHARL